MKNLNILALLSIIKHEGVSQLNYIQWLKIIFVRWDILIVSFLWTSPQLEQMAALLLVKQVD